MKIYEIINESPDLDEANFNITMRDARIILSELGFTLTRKKGSHELWTKEGERTFPINRHDKQLSGFPAGELFKLMKKYNYTR